MPSFGHVTTHRIGENSLFVDFSVQRVVFRFVPEVNRPWATLLPRYRRCKISIIFNT
jgi:hypothetical protein